MSGGPTNFFPGGQGNPVGFAAAPGFTSLAASTTFAAYAAAQGGGIVPNNSTVSFQDFDAGTGETHISNNGIDSGPALSNVKFLGCRFQSNDTASGDQTNVECFKSGSNNITFSYCSMVPRVALHPTVPNAAWPAASVGTGVTTASGSYSTYVIPYADGFLFGISPGSNSGPITLDHCDIWGGANLINTVATAASPLTISDCWIHDARNADPPNWSVGTTYSVGDIVEATDLAIYQSKTNGNIANNPTGGGSPANWTQINSTHDHTDGFGFYQGGVAPTNITLYHCTIALIGTTDLIGLQSTTTQYVNWIMNGNYLSGDNVMAEMGDLATNTNNNVTFTNNIFATDIAHTGALVNHTSNAVWRANAMKWRNNRLFVYPNDTWSGYTASQSGFYVYPDGTVNATEFS